MIKTEATTKQGFGSRVRSRGFLPVREAPSFRTGHQWQWGAEFNCTLLIHCEERSETYVAPSVWAATWSEAKEELLLAIRDWVETGFPVSFSLVVYGYDWQPVKVLDWPVLPVSLILARLSSIDTLSINPGKEF